MNSRQAAWLLSLLLVLSLGYQVLMHSTGNSLTAEPNGESRLEDEMKPESQSHIGNETLDPVAFRLQDRSDNEKVKDKKAQTTERVWKLRRQLLNFEDRLPSIDMIRAEIEANPHSTAESSIRFAAYLAPLMEEALRSVEFASDLMEKMESCVDSTMAIPVSVRALCLFNAQRLARRFPEQLRNSFNLIFTKAEESEKALVRAILSTSEGGS